MEAGPSALLPSVDLARMLQCLVRYLDRSSNNDLAIRIKTKFVHVVESFLSRSKWLPPRKENFLRNVLLIFISGWTSDSIPVNFHHSHGMRSPADGCIVSTKLSLLNRIMRRFTNWTLLVCDAFVNWYQLSNCSQLIISPVLSIPYTCALGSSIASLDSLWLFLNDGCGTDILKRFHIYELHRRQSHWLRLLF